MSELVRPPGISRRRFLHGASLSALAVGGAGLLSSCGTSGAKVAQGSCVSTDKSASQKVLSFSNWPAYIDPISGKSTSTLEKFEHQSGIAVSYQTDVNDNEAFYAKVAPELKDCKSTGRDIFVLTDWMAARMIDLGWLQKLDHSKLPNVDANLLDSLKSPPWDPKREYSVPWQSGMTGICYNSDLTDPVTSFKELLTRANLKGKVDLLSEMRDTMLFMLLLEGADPEKFSAGEFSKAITSLTSFVTNGQIRRFTGNDYLDDLKSGDVVACEAWSGDIPQLGDPKFVWLAPEEGISLWSDNMLVPNQAEHKTNAEELMNFYYEPVIAAQLAAWNYYFCPVNGAQSHMAQFDKSAVHDPLIFPNSKMLANGYTFMGLSDNQNQDYQAQFSQVQGG